MAYDRSRYQDKWRLERLARQIRAEVGLSPSSILDPWRLADAVPAHVFYPEDLIPFELAQRARAIDWDGFAFAFPKGDVLVILLNPARSWRRQSATLLEELSHHFLRHQPSRLYPDSATGQLRRDFNKEQEEEAYDFGSVLLLPKELVQHYVKETVHTASELAELCRCSSQLIELRIKRCRLWNRYLSTRSRVTVGRVS